MKCIICNVNETEGNYCSECFSKAIIELDEKYGKKEALSEPLEENREGR